MKPNCATNQRYFRIIMAECIHENGNRSSIQTLLRGHHLLQHTELSEPQHRFYLVLRLCCSAAERGQLPRSTYPIGDAFFDCALAPVFTCFDLPRLAVIFVIIPTIITGIIRLRILDMSIPPACWEVDCNADIEPICWDRIIGKRIVVVILFASMGIAESKLLQTCYIIILSC